MNHYWKQSVCAAVACLLCCTGCHTQPDSNHSSVNSNLPQHSSESNLQISSSMNITSAASEDSVVQSQTQTHTNGSSSKSSSKSPNTISSKTTSKADNSATPPATNVSPALSVSDAKIAARLGLCVSETPMANDSVAKKQKRYQMLKNEGVTTARVSVTWSSAEPSKGNWRDPGLVDMGVAVSSGLRIKLITETIMNPPSWIFQEHPEAYMVNQDGERSLKNCLSYWLPQVENYTKEAADHLFSSLKKNNFLDSVDAVVVDLGAAGEPIYPPAWTQPPSTQDKMWCYADNAQADFRNTMKTKYKNISAANKAWGKKYANFESITVPKPDSGTTGQMWEDVLVWYRNVKRNFIEKQIKNYQEVVKKYTNGRVKLILYLPGSDIRDSRWNQAIEDGSAHYTIRIMCDNRFMMDMAKKYGCWLQYTGVNDAVEAAYNRNYMNSIGIANTPIFGENAGNYENAKDPKTLVKTIMQNGYYGIDYTFTAFLYESDCITKSDVYPKFVTALDTLKTYLARKAG